MARSPSSWLAPVFLRLPFHGGSGRVLDLDPVVGAAGDVARANALAHDALAPQLAGVFEHLRAVDVKVLAELQSATCTLEEMGQLALACLDWHRPQVLAVKLQ